MLRDELSGAVSIFCQTSAAGTALPAELRLAYSARHNSAFMLTQKRVTKTSATRDAMVPCRFLLHRQIHGLAHAHAPFVQARIRSHQRSTFHPVFSADDAGRISRLVALTVWRFA